MNRRLLFFILSFIAFPSVVAAQRGSVELQVPAGAMEVGEATTIQLICRNTGVPSAPEAVVPDGLDLRLLNTTPSFSSMTRIINGRRSSEETHTFTMKLTALTEGTHMLGPITITAGGATYSTAPRRIVVRRTDVGSGPDGDRFILVDLQVTPRSLYVTQTYTATLTISIRKVKIDGRIHNFDMLRQVLDLNSSQLSVFARGRAERSERWLSDSNRNRHRYEVFRVVQKIRAEEVGEVMVGPVFLKANYPTRVRRGFFGRIDVAQYREEFARADNISVTVKAPPQEGRPASYNGAIGRFTMDVEVRPTRVERGEPITLAIAIRGTPLGGVAGPDLTGHPELASRFDFTKDEMVGDLEGNAKIFRRAVFPKQSGHQTIPPLIWSYFDPNLERYVTLESPPIDIVVDPRSDSGMTIALPDVAMSEAPETRLTLLSGGISPNFVNADEVLADHSFKLTTPWLASMIASPFAWLAITLMASHRARIRSDGSFARRRRASSQARKRINHAVRSGDVPQQMSALAGAITHYVSDRYGLGAGTLTADDVNAVLRSSGVDEGLVAEIVKFLESCDAVRYTPGAIGSMSPDVAVANARRWLARLERSKA